MHFLEAFVNTYEEQEKSKNSLPLLFPTMRDRALLEKWTPGAEYIATKYTEYISEHIGTKRRRQTAFSL